METILLQAQAQQGSGWTSIIMMAAVVLIFWLFMIRPQQKRQKEVQRVRVDRGSVFPAASDEVTK